MDSREKQYATIVINFANGETVDDACSKYFEDLETHLNFSPGFAQKVKASFPSQQKGDDLDFSEREIIQLIFDQIRFKRHLSELFFNYNWTRVMGWDSRKKKVRIQYYLGSKADDAWVTMQQLEDLFLREFKIKMNKSIAESCKRLFELGRLVKSKLDANWDKKTRGTSYELYQKLRSAQSSLSESQNTLRQALATLNEPGYINDNTVGMILRCYNRIPNLRLVAMKDGRLVDVPPIVEEDYYLYPELRNRPGAIENWSELITNHLAYFFVEFLRNPQNRKLIGKCDECGKFFIKNRIDSKQKTRFCSTKCRLALHNREDIASGKRAAQKREKHGWKPRARVNVD